MANDIDWQWLFEEGRRVSPDNMYAGLKNGDVVCAVFSQPGYLLDCAEEIARLFPQNNGFPHNEVFSFFLEDNEKKKGMMGEARKQGNDSIVPYSLALKHRYGHCIEKSIMAQIFYQIAKIPSYLVIGYLSCDGDRSSPHAFNFFEDGGVWKLHDPHNPLRIDAEFKVTKPYIARLVDYENGAFVVEACMEGGRKYTA